jgi:hypothetical protein
MRTSLLTGVFCSVRVDCYVHVFICGGGGGCGNCSEYSGRHRRSGDQVPKIRAALAYAIEVNNVICVACKISIGIGSSCTGVLVSP